MKSGNLEVLHSTIVNQINVFLQERGIGIPDQWTTYELIKEHVINDETLFNFNNTDYLNKMIEDLSVAQNPVWVEATIDIIKIISPSPLDQFSIVPFFPMKTEKLYFSFTNKSFIN
ncbi:hypothetical protein Salmi_Mp062 (mitochondrion) [Salvia miltiorrhiza]|uniref:Uncharacterized protein n=1 Tax=Salvia miltiorrhiza TaxID=226208 RepID=V9P4Y6_SALMI|nr:hypothetical protein Salmi_Mp062 [Salvia miltiorrhiza]AGU16591.1 hypothetical protein Salmi_Mp062 [Salvia miltiorrhiza]